MTHFKIAIQTEESFLDSWVPRKVETTAEKVVKFHECSSVGYSSHTSRQAFLVFNTGEDSQGRLTKRGNCS